MPHSVHFLAVATPEGGTLCGLAGTGQRPPETTVLVERLTCPDCLDRLNRLLGDRRNRLLLAHLGKLGGERGWI